LKWSLRRRDRGQHIGLVEQHLLLIRRHIGLAESLGGSVEELALQPPHLLLEHPLALERLAVLALELFVDLLEPLVRLLDLTDGFFGDFQSRLQCGGRGAAPQSRKKFAGRFGDSSTKRPVYLIDLWPR